MNIGIFGSAFNPPTLGHADVIRRASEQFDEVWLIPSINHAFGKQMLPLDVREELCEAFLHDLSIKGALLASIESELPDGVVYTIDLLDHLAARHPSDSFTFIIGQDNVDHFEKFERHEEILKRHSVLGLSEQKQIRSTMIRNGIEQNSNNWHELTTPSVVHLIEKKSLFSANAHVA